MSAATAAAAFGLMMLKITPSGDAHTHEDLAAISKRAGFAGVEPCPPISASAG